MLHPEFGARAQDAARAKIAERLAFVEDHLARSGPLLMGERFTAADAYLFTIVGWSAFTRIDLSAFPHIREFMARVGARPNVRSDGGRRHDSSGMKGRSEEHTSELQSLMRISYAVFCLNKKT